MTVFQFYNGMDESDLFTFNEKQTALSKMDFRRKYFGTPKWNADIIRVETVCGKQNPAIHIITI